MNGTECHGSPTPPPPAASALRIAAEVCRDLGPALLRARVDGGLKQSELGALAGVSGAMVSKYENGANQPPLEVLVAMAVVLGTGLDRLTGLEDLRAPEPMLSAGSPLRAALARLPGELGDALALILGGFLAATAERAARPGRHEIRRRIEPLLERAGVAAGRVPEVADEIAALAVAPRTADAPAAVPAVPAAAPQPGPDGASHVAARPRQ